MPPRPRIFPALVVSMLSALTVTVRASDTPAPSAVVIPGSLQSELGCPGDWQADCVTTALAFDADDAVWQGTFTVPAGSWEYKAALNNAWDENYGANAARNGPNIALSLLAPVSVKFYYSHETHWVADNRNKVIAVAPGSFQSELGCPGDWQPDCLRSWLQDPDGDGIYGFRTRAIPAGSYEVKVAIGESWTENYGADGAPSGAKIPFTVAGDCVETVFRYDAVTHVLTVAAGVGYGPQPPSVTIPGSFQSEVACSGDWQADCAATHLAFDAQDGVWQGTFNVPLGSWQYKAALNDSWDENYGGNATRNGPDIGLSVATAAPTKFYYSHETHWVTDSRKLIAVAPGSFQSELGCSGDWQPDCLRSWLQDPDGDGLYVFRTNALPAGTYEVKVAIGESWDLNYGAGGVQNGPNIPFTVPPGCQEVVFTYDATTHVLTVGAEGAPRGNLARARAHWLSADTIAWSPGAVQPGWTVTLHYAVDGGLVLGTGGVSGGTAIPLTWDPAGLSAPLRAAFPHLAAYAAFHVPPDRLAEVRQALKAQLAVSALDGSGSPVDATSVQIPGVLDDLYAYDGPLGVVFEGGVPTLRVWAPTARSVKLHLFPSSSSTEPTVHAMAGDPATGVWSIRGEAGWEGWFYLYEVEVWTRATMSIVTNKVTDPYSVSLARNSRRSQIVDLDDAALKPAGWDTLAKPPLAAPEDITLYELHVRDFSAHDLTVPEALRGTFRAFTQESSNGMRHLAALARAGLTHVHLLPSFDIATVDEDKSQWQDPGDLSTFAPDSDQQQAKVAAVADHDAYNWGYDPWHYTVPEGSYACDADGAARVLEFREMVQGLGHAGLRVVMDVVYNHTTASGQNEKSVLDRVVPGYYHRLNAEGEVEKSSCCENTASEHRMMEKLLVDSAVTWAKQYKVDGFRFDLMGHHMKRNMLRLRQALDALTLARDGVDGSKVYVYGEGWNFGEVADGKRGENAIQRNMAGTGIGTFNDRLRDGARGGGPFSGIQEQGFLTGLFYNPNATNQGPDDQRARLLQEMDWVRVGLSGNLADYEFVDRLGNTVKGRQVDYNGQAAGYTSDPQEVINYVEAHDNDTLFDAIQLKAPVGTSMADRVRIQNLGMSLLAFGQGVPFFHAGVELLRSKSLDRNSYNSGDWFNRLDFTYETDNWGVGLPPAGDNQANWLVMAPLLGNPALRPASADILDAFAHFQEVLAIRRSSPLFRLRTAAEVQSRLAFHNTGPAQVPGVIALSLADDDGVVDRRHALVAVVLNANDEAQTLGVPALAGRPLVLHPLQAASADPVVRTAIFEAATASFRVPGRTAAVFVAARPAADQVALLERDVEALVSSGVLERGSGRALLALLAGTERHLRHGAITAARAELRAFLLRVEALEKTGGLSEPQADALAAEANAILGLIGG
jgi:pullulanase-type alpha-1,6-glucosidase